MKINLQDTEIHALLRMLNYYFLHINEPPATEPIKLLIHAAGMQTTQKLEKKYFRAIANNTKKTEFKITNIEKSFLLIFLQNLEIKKIQPYELAAREIILFKLSRL